jgi:protein-S-isoprenylcysteine O-methyltransferase Ste14
MSALEIAAFLGAIQPALWLAWAIYWLISARNVKQTARRETTGQRWSHALPFLFAAWLLFRPRTLPWLCHRIWPESGTTYFIGTGALIAGLLFTVWARVVLGANWSGTVTVKQDHELIQTGPYRWVRHPIYTGLLVALAGSAIAQDLWTSALAWAIIVAALWIKLRREEAWMRETFGAQYERYCARTARLVPFVL